MQRIYSGGIKSRFYDTFIGDRKFYRTVLTLFLPVVAQNILSMFVNLLDNVMVGQVGLVHMSGVAIANQLIFVFNLAVFGAVSGAGIYGAQFAGARDWEGLRQTFRFKLLVAFGITAIAVCIMAIFAEPIISLYLKGEGAAADAAAMLSYGKQYLSIMLWGLLPFALTQCYSGTLRETGKTFLPMAASISAILVNLTFNYLLIYGKFGFPELGVRGAAIATVMSRFVELGIVAIWTHAHHKKYFFIKGVYRSLRVTKKLAAGIAVKGVPLLVNELLWSLGMTTLMQVFSTRGLMVVSGLTVASTINNLFNVFLMSMGTAVAVMVGQALGANNIQLAKRYVWKLIFFSVSISVVLASALAVFPEFFSGIYNLGEGIAEEQARQLAAVFMRTSALYMVFNAIIHCCYFSMRSGGKVYITVLFDSVYTWVICVPYAFIMVHYTGLSIELLYPLCYLTDVLKCVIGVLIIRTGHWAKNMINVEGLSVPDITVSS